jgi:hypothetical protein
VDYTEFHKTMCEKHAKAEERQERLRRRRRIYLNVIMIVLATALLALGALRLTR